MFKSGQLSIVCLKEGSKVISEDFHGQCDHWDAPNFTRFPIPTSTTSLGLNLPAQPTATISLPDEG